MFTNTDPSLIFVIAYLLSGTSQGGSILDVYLGKDSGADSTYKSSRSSRGVRSKRDSTYHFLLSLKQELVTSKNRVRDLERKFADTDRKLKDALLRISKQVSLEAQVGL